jgi:hypothetical protein
VSLWLWFFASALFVVRLARLSKSARFLFAKFQVSLSSWVQSVSSGNLAFWLYQVSKANVFFGHKFWSVKGLGIASVLQVSFLVVAKVKGSCNNFNNSAVVFFSGSESCKSKACQQSVQPTGGILPHFRAFFWLRAFSCFRSESRPAHQRLTQTVGWHVAQ